MPGINGKIVMTTCEGRPCWVKGRRAIFHRWTDSARPVKPASNDQDTDERMQKWSVHGLVEYEDGTVEREWPSAIRFADSAEKFAGICWDALEARRDDLPYTDMELPLLTQPHENGIPAWGTKERAEKCDACEIKNACLSAYSEHPCPKEQNEAKAEQAAEVWKECETCAHGTENEEFCQLAEYDCKACTVRGCYCKRCKEFDRWEPKEE